MPEIPSPGGGPGWGGFELASPSGLTAECHANGGLRRLMCGPTCVSLWVGNALEPGPANLYLRQHGETLAWTALLGPASPTRWARAGALALAGAGEWRGIEYAVVLRLAADAPAWFWHVCLKNRTGRLQQLDVTWAQDIALAPYWALRLNEYYVSQYVDHTPLTDPVHGYVVASRQNLAAQERHPWSLLGSLRAAASFGTDALQLHGLAHRSNEGLLGLDTGLPGRRLQHEHSMVTIQGAPLTLSAGESVRTGFFGLFVEDHPQASGPADLARIGAVRSLPEAAPPSCETVDGGVRAAASRFDTAPPLPVRELAAGELQGLFAGPWRHEERDAQGTLLSFFHGDASHVVLAGKERQVLRPHGHILRSGLHLTPDETALTSTAWMSGVFHSMLTQGHVSLNRLLSTAHSYLDLLRMQGLRVFVEREGRWWRLHTPSAFEIAPAQCRWIYRPATGMAASPLPGGAPASPAGLIEVCARSLPEPREMALSLAARDGAPPRWLICLHLAVNGDDGCAPGVPGWTWEGDEIRIAPAPGTEMAGRFPGGAFRLRLSPPASLEKIGGDELLFMDGVSRGEPCLCLLTQPAERVELGIRGELIPASAPPPLLAGGAGDLTPGLALRTPPGRLGAEVSRLAELSPWLAQNAWVHYLAPRGLEQYSGGGWGTRDVCQGPVELLLTLGQHAALRDLLLRVMAAQNPDGDWPQWFMFFERDRAIRAGDSHADIVLWPVVALAQYLEASGDATILDEEVPCFTQDPAQGMRIPVWEHVQRALALAARRTIPGSALMAYGHGDWNDSLQPADRRLRERLCSSWTVTLHHRALMTLAGSLRSVGRHLDVAVALTAQAARIREDFQRLLMVDGVLAGYALFEPDRPVTYLLHPRDEVSGVRYSALAMSHAILEDMLTPAQAAAHLRLVRSNLTGPDGVHLFDRPMPYHGGPERIFQRAESATFFGREIGLMYMHAHLRHAQALAHAGDAEGFFQALCQVNPIGLHERVPAAAPRQSNCYYSSSDAAFADRYEARAEYSRVAAGTVPLEGGWRVYSSGAGIAFRLIHQVLLGIAREPEAVRIDPVMPAGLDGLTLSTTLLGRTFEVRYRVGERGCGVRRILINGEAVPFQERPGLYRAGAALLPHALLRAQAARDANQLDIELG